MSLYRFARLSALLAFAGKYRMKLFLIGAAAAFALVTSWLYTDVASFLQQHYPQWIGLALVFKTLIVYAALFFCCGNCGRHPLSPVPRLPSP